MFTAYKIFSHTITHKVREKHILNTVGKKRNNIYFFARNFGVIAV